MTHFTVRQEEAYIHADDERGQIKIRDDELLLDAEYRGANRIVVAVAVPVSAGAEAPSDGQCAYVKDDGERCQNAAQDDSAYCWQHEDA